MTTRRIAALTPEEPRLEVLIPAGTATEQMARALYDALRFKEPELAECFAVEYQRLVGERQP